MPDGSRVGNNVSFTKTWRVRNSGSCDWDAGMGLSFESGDQMGASDRREIGALKVGQQAEVSVVMVAPSAEGQYQGKWRVEDAAGNHLGDSLTVMIYAGSPPPPTRPPAPTAARVLPVSTVASVPPTAPPVIAKPMAVPPQPSGGCVAGAMAICCDGSTSFSGNRSGTCSRHGGVCRWCQ